MSTYARPVRSALLLYFYNDFKRSSSYKVKAQITNFAQLCSIMTPASSERAVRPRRPIETFIERKLEDLPADRPK